MAYSIVTVVVETIINCWHDGQQVVLWPLDDLYRSSFWSAAFRARGKTTALPSANEFTYMQITIVGINNAAFNGCKNNDIIKLHGFMRTLVIISSRIKGSAKR